MVKGHSDFKVKYMTLGLYTQVSDSGPHGPLVLFPFTEPCWIVFAKPEDLETWPNHFSQGQEFIIFSDGCLDFSANLPT